MAMNKKEQAQMQALADELALEKAWRRTEPVLRDLPLPNGCVSKYTSGWDFNLNTGSVSPHWSKSISHGSGTAPERHVSGRQGGRVLFSTEVRALRALRYAVEREAMRDLAVIDKQIAELDAEKKGGA